MFDANAYLWGLTAILLAVTGTWVVSLWKRDVSIVDSLWSVLFLLAVVVYWATVTEAGPRAAIVVTLVTLWAVRLSGHITWRNWAQPEDHRYQEIRRRNEPHFALKSSYLVFGLQGLLAWVISLPLLAAVASPVSASGLDYLAAAVVVFGLLFETVADYQLARFKRHPGNQRQVMDQGLWRYSRHPNYFGEFCVWWGFYVFALAAGGWWSIISPLLMSLLLLRVSGVTLLEKDIGKRRPGYADYVKRTNAFIPGPPRSESEFIQHGRLRGE